MTILPMLGCKPRPEEPDVFEAYCHNWHKEDDNLIWACKYCEAYEPYTDEEIVQVVVRKLRGWPAFR